MPAPYKLKHHPHHQSTASLKGFWRIDWVLEGQEFPVSNSACYSTRKIELIAVTIFSGSEKASSTTHFSCRGEGRATVDAPFHGKSKETS
jgi:hypothetical protein